MKKKIFALAVAAMAVLGAQAQYVNGHEYVDLGLPSGTLWATMNVGSNDEAKEGESCYFEGVSSLMTWGDTWVIPTHNQWGELVDNCTITSDMQMTADNSNEGNTITYYKFTSKINGKSIVFPASYRRVTDNGVVVEKHFTIDPIWVSSGDIVLYSYIYNVPDNETYSYKSSDPILIDSQDGKWNLRLVTTKSEKETYTISDIPEGWTIKSGETAADAETVTVTDGTANYIPVENVVVITPVNIPLGKKIKSIKAVPAE
ncbi:MAG: hypothetical protein E7073_02195 [Bacteroidales bacterium]|nr:hypothetical protein [Bacteroidales bacterium]